MTKRFLLTASAVLCLCSCGTGAKISPSNGSIGPELAGSSPSHSRDVVNAGDNGTAGYSNIFDYLRAKVPGIQIGYAAPGSTPSILIRGGSGSFNGGTQPLFIVDGAETPNIANISPYDIASVEVLKDSSTALYGVRGANGVIIIKTKSAREAAIKAAAEKKAARQADKKK